MRVTVTGTPGTGKTTATDLVTTDLDVLHLNDVIRDEAFATGTDPDRGSLVADMDALGAWLDDRDDVLVESHLAHHFPADMVVVLRCRPDDLEQRLRDRGEAPEKARENADAEALDVVLSEAVERHGLDAVYEIDTTDRSPEAVATDIESVIEGDREPSAGTVDFLEYL
ncbi:adenylate kinase family protein [Halorarius litoreus]|uniref:adenylate kinase family protein n=1 Tax=Halorarius litoreus TaxID=2962676 RepID=UPI0020CC12EB|nr:adenylate kinase family protein [Halorarius litoreus]